MSNSAIFQRCKQQGKHAVMVREGPSRPGAIGANA
jgi:hypothetical protein